MDQDRLEQEFHGAEGSVSLSFLNFIYIVALSLKEWSLMTAEGRKKHLYEECSLLGKNTEQVCIFQVMVSPGSNIKTIIRITGR